MNAGRFTWALIGIALPVLIWLAVKYGVGVEDRYLPAPTRVLQAFADIKNPGMAQHAASTAWRVFSGLTLGAIAGLALGIALFSNSYASRLLLPTVQSMRSVPPVAAVPFILMWFGFAESGKTVLVVLGVGLNVAIATYQILTDADQKYLVAFHGFRKSGRELPLRYLLPLAVQSLLPTLRFSLSLAIGVVVVSELLGSQIGLGYLIQTSRTTYSMHTIFAAVFLLGFLNWALDAALRGLWHHLVFWKTTIRNRAATP